MGRGLCYDLSMKKKKKQKVTKKQLARAFAEVIRGLNRVEDILDSLLEKK